jgi:hypothetical protein
MMDKVLADLPPAGEDRQFQRVKSQIGAQVISDLPADDLAGKKVADERGIREAAGRVRIGDIGAQRRFGAGAVKSRRTRSAGCCPAGAGTVVRGFFRWPLAPSMPSSRISRSTVHRATLMPSRRSCRHTFRAPYRPRPFARSFHTRMICFFSHSSRRVRRDG